MAYRDKPGAVYLRSRRANKLRDLRADLLPKDENAANARLIVQAVNGRTDILAKLELLLKLRSLGRANDRRYSGGFALPPDHRGVP